jgi:ArsR family transcriptional regulator, lead/cadmium/zinc/bismuth-responsive transcriptional repressor
MDLELAEAIRHRRIQPSEAGRASERAQALADATRLTIAAALSEAAELCVCDLAWIVERSQNLVSHHLKVLRLAGLVTARRDGKLVMYALTDEGRALVATVISQEAVVGG